MKSTDWLDIHAPDRKSVAKETDVTRAWFATIQSQSRFCKLYPPDKLDSWAKIERAIAGAKLHSSIVPLLEVIECEDGDLFLYPQVEGENLNGSDGRRRFLQWPVEDRLRIVCDIGRALSAVCQAGFVVVDWYEGNTIVDFDRKRVWLFDWELCRPGNHMILEMDSNYGSSRLMAPEEFVRGSVIDETTLVYNLARFALLYLPELADELAESLSRATYPSRVGRTRSLSDLIESIL